MPNRASLMLAALAWLTFACAARSGVPAREGPSGSGAWASALHRDHPLVGRIWDVRQARWTDEAALAAAVARADFVLLGETHDNPDHHLLQAKLLRALAASGRRPAVAFEMLDTEQQDEIDRALEAAPRDPDAIAEAVGWARSGWPDFSLYRPVFAAALDAGLAVVAANLTRKRARDVAARGSVALSPGVRDILDRAGPLSEDAARALRREMSESHCGELPASMLDPLVLMQRARDAQLAERLLDRAGPEGAVLVAGAGHVRADRGVPVYLTREAPARRSAAVAFLEVSPERRDPADYRDGFGSGALPFDYVLFTPATKREDPCLQLRRHHRRPAPSQPSTPI